MKWHEEVVNASTILAVKRLVEVCKDDFYLAGGTALALQKGHRISLDLDCFSKTNTLSSKERSGIIQALQASGPLDIRASEDRTCHLIIESTFVSLFHYPYPLIEPLKIRWRGLFVAGMEDICGMKLSAVLGRGSKKDFIDLYIICKKVGIERIFEIGKLKFPKHGNFLIQMARALVYFDDADPEPMPKMIADTDWEQVKQYFSQNVPKYLKKGPLG